MQSADLKAGLGRAVAIPKAACWTAVLLPRKGEREMHKSSKIQCFWDETATDACEDLMRS